MTSGFLLVDKPAGWTSHDVVAKVRSVSRIKKVGHGGTLDPMATGLLVVGLGAATKQLDTIIGSRKTYLATVRLGAISTTDDDEGDIQPQPVVDEPQPLAVKQSLQSFVGDLQQIPPVYSAIKTAGRKHYDLARAGQTVERQPRPVTIHSIELLEYAWPDVIFRSTVSKGTYIRSLARDLGHKLGTGGYLTALKRERIGNLSLEDAYSVDAVVNNWDSVALRPLEELAKA